jgi:hypothetical protein
MKARDLRELEEFESERTSRYAIRMLRNKDQGIPMCSADLYPEFRLEPPYTQCVGSIRPVNLLPFHNAVIVDLRPLPTSDQFIARYGLSPESFLELSQQGRIAVRVRVPYRTFANLDYLDEFFRLSPPPLSLRWVHLYPEHSAYVEMGRQLCPNRRPRGTHWSEEYKDWKLPPTFKEVFAHKFAMVSCYFGSDYAREITNRAKGSINDPAVAYDWMHAFSRLRVYPYSNCLDGVNVLPIQSFTELPQDLKNPRIPFLRQPEPLPYEVGRALTLTLSLAVPGNLQSALSVPAMDWMKALTRLDKALEDADPTVVEQQCTAIAQIARDTQRDVETMLKRKKTIEHTIATISGIGVVGALSEYAPPNWRPIIGVAAGAAFTLRSRIADTVVKFAKKGHITAWFSVRRKMQPTIDIKH